ncbi:MAG: alpha/beta hydrolase [Acidimicrobiia bacterium]|nr:alpha/beta hydrolase [Acidimicrobiia bacterium]
MPFAMTDDNVNLYFEEAGAGVPILFIHEFAGDHRSWGPQVSRFARSHRCITYAARGYPPSDVPAGKNSYSQSRAVDDALAVLDYLEVDKAHIVGLSMGGFTALHFGLRHADRALSLVVSGAGYGAQPEKEEGFRRECAMIAQALETEDMKTFAARYAEGPARVQFQNKDPRGWAVFAESLAGHNAIGSALTMRGVQQERPSLYQAGEELSALTVPTLIVVGDEDEGCLEPGLMLKRTIPTAGLLVLPKTGHTTNLEEPEMFNEALDRLFGLAEAGRWDSRDPRSLATSATGMDG